MSDKVFWASEEWVWQREVYSFNRYDGVTVRGVLRHNGRHCFYTVYVTPAYSRSYLYAVCPLDWTDEMAEYLRTCRAAFSPYGTESEGVYPADMPQFERIAAFRARWGSRDPIRDVARVGLIGLRPPCRENSMRVYRPGDEIPTAADDNTYWWYADGAKTLRPAYPVQVQRRSGELYAELPDGWKRVADLSGLWLERIDVPEADYLWCTHCQKSDHADADCWSTQAVDIEQKIKDFFDLGGDR